MAGTKSTKMIDLLADGVTRKCASYYLEHAEAETFNSAYDSQYVKWAHEHGFLAESAYAYGLNEDNFEDYFSDYDFYKVWPLNNWSRIWVNDKLTLKLMLADKELEGFMPEYYYYAINKTLKPLGDTPYHDGDVFQNFIRLLKEKKEFACKPCNGVASAGFAHIIFEENDLFLINGKRTNSSGIKEFIEQNPNYIFTEYIRPSKQFARYGSLIHTLRIVVINERGDTPVIVGGYLRLPNKCSGEANYVILDDTNIEKFNVFCDVDFETGEFANAKKIFCDHIRDIEVHPDTGEKIAGKIEKYDELIKIIKYVSCKFSNLEYLGFDIGITDDGFKCMEINTHPGIKYMQIFKPFFKDSLLGKYFAKKIEDIDALDETAKSRRNEILR